MTIPPPELQRFNPAVNQSVTGLCRTPTNKRNQEKTELFYTIQINQSACLTTTLFNGVPPVKMNSLH
jgi:hypothetical protein